MITIHQFDHDIEKVGDMGNFAFLDPDISGPTENNYCVGLRYLGGDVLNPNNWKYDHTNYWGPWYEVEKEPEPRVISLAELKSLLDKHGATLENLCREYIKLAFAK